jgi:hypothetical protein
VGGGRRNHPLLTSRSFAYDAPVRLAGQPLQRVQRRSTIHKYAESFFFFLLVSVPLPCKTTRQAVV